MKRRPNPNTWKPLFAYFPGLGLWMVTLPQWRSYLAVVDDFGDLVEVAR